MTVKDALHFGETKLKQMETPHLDAAVLLAFIFKKPKIFLYAHSEKILTAKQWRDFKTLIKRRLKHEPIAYLIGQKEFYGRTFFVNKRVLIPRPETELLIDLAKTIPADKIIDVGTGSGAMAITLAKELKNQIIAIDISREALAVAKKNARHHHTKIKFLHGNLLEPILKSTSYADISASRFPYNKDKIEHRDKLQATSYLIVANLPYLPIKRAKLLPPDIKKYEPRLALFGGKDGLKYYRALLQQLKNLNPQKWTLLAEIDPSTKKQFTPMAKKILPKADISFHQDLSGRNRFVKIKII